MLSGCTVLIVEAQYLIALDLQDLLERFSPEGAIIAQDAAHAAEIAPDISAFGLAIVDVERRQADQVALVNNLIQNKVPVIVTTADAELRTQLNWMQGTPVLSKPVSTEAFYAAVETLLQTDP